MRLLITGGAGFIGSNLIHELLAPNQDQPDITPELVVNLDCLTYSGNLGNLAGLEKDPRYLFVHGSILDQPLISQLLETHRIQAVLHLAAESHVDRSIDTPFPFVETNVVGTLHMLEAARHYHALLPEQDRSKFRFLHISTDEVFGSLGPRDPSFTETTPYDPRSPYSASKAGSDHLVRAYHHTYGLPILITNCSNNYGPRQFPEKLIPLVILNALEGRPLPIYGDGGQRRDWLHVRDHALALERVLRFGRAGETYTVGGESEVTNLQIVQQICKILDRLAPVSGAVGSHASAIVHVKDRPGHDRRYSICIDKIRHQLEWKPKETLATGLEQTVQWYLDNRAWCEDITRIVMPANDWELCTPFHENMKLSATQGNIVKLQVDAIVNAANTALLGGGGVDGAIHNAAGPELLAECRLLHGCETGGAKITKGYRLPAKHIIHTVGPVWDGGNSSENELLASCYRKSLNLAEEHGVTSIAFPAISTGIYAFPLVPACTIAVKTVQEWIDKHPSSVVQEIIFCCFDRKTLGVYEQLLAG